MTPANSKHDAALLGANPASPTATYVLRLLRLRPRAGSPNPIRHSRRVRIDAYELNLSTRQLLAQGANVRLERLPLDLLEALVDKAGQLVTRDELIQSLWPVDPFMDVEHSLNLAVNKVRRALLDSAKRPRFIETCYGQGYRFIGEIEAIRTLPVDGVKVCLAILAPFSTSPSRLDNDISEELMRALEGILGEQGRVLVIRQLRNSERQSHTLEIARQAGAQYVVSFYLRHNASEPPQVSVEMSSALAGNLLWSASYTVATGKSEIASMAAVEIVAALNEKGLKLAVQSEPQRIAIPWPGWAYNMIVLGMDHKLVAVSQITAASKVFEKIGKSHISRARPAFLDDSVNLNELIQADPDIVFLGIGDNRAARIRAAGFKVFELSQIFCSGASFRTLHSTWSHACGDAAVKNYQKFMEYWDSRIAHVSSRVSDIPSALRPTVLALHCSIPNPENLPAGHYFVIGGTLLANDLIRCCGAVSPLRAEFSNSPGEQLVTFEQIKAWDPDILVVAGEKQALMHEPGWETLKAVKHERVYSLPTLMHLWGVSSPEMILYFQWIAKNIFPERFKDLDILHEAQQFYKHYFRCDMPTKELQAMLNGQ